MTAMLNPTANGRAVRRLGLSLRRNPYQPHDREFAEWNRGWFAEDARINQDRLKEANTHV